MGNLRDRLARSKLANVSFMIVNEQEAESRAMYWELKRRAAKGIPVYQQSPLQDDVWAALQGEKDDVLIYDRCGKLTFHIVLPYSFLNFPYVEAAIRATYHRDICNCSLHSVTSFESGFNNSTDNDTMSSPPRADSEKIVQTDDQQGPTSRPDPYATEKIPPLHQHSHSDSDRVHSHHTHIHNQHDNTATSVNNVTQGNHDH